MLQAPTCRPLIPVWELYETAPLAVEVALFRKRKSKSGGGGGSKCRSDASAYSSRTGSEGDLPLRLEIHKFYVAFISNPRI